MRGLLAVVLLVGCGGVGVGPTGATRPGVMPMLSELPADAAKRDAVLDASNTTAGPEQRGSLTTKEQAAETVGATAAAILGSLFSKTKNVTIGAATRVDENQLVRPHAGPPRAPSAAPAGDPATADPAAPVAAPAAAPADDPGPSNADLIPWIKLK